jgi:hypothetical protein
MSFRRVEMRRAEDSGARKAARVFTAGEQPNATLVVPSDAQVPKPPHALATRRVAGHAAVAPVRLNQTLQHQMNGNRLTIQWDFTRSQNYTPCYSKPTNNALSIEAGFNRR